MTYSWGKTRKLLKLKKNNKYYMILALDHALTVGPIVGIKTIEEMNSIINFAENINIPAVVLNFGYITKLSNFSKTNIVTQTMGLPNKKNQNYNKIPLVAIDELPSIDTTAISVQINFSSENLQDYIYNIAQIVNDASRYEYPILFMIGDKDWDSIEEFEYAIRVCCELGADLIKIRLPSQDNILNQIKKISKEHIPLLLAGGEKSEKFEKQLIAAKELGFQGICVGRNIFQSNNPSKVIQLIDRIFSDES